jgi:hypothetical protein
MSRAVFNVEGDEFDRAKSKLEKKKKRNVTVKEVMNHEGSKQCHTGTYHPQSQCRSSTSLHARQRCQNRAYSFDVAKQC